MANIGITLSANAGGLQSTLNQAAGWVQSFGARSTESLKSVAQESNGLQGAIEGLGNGLKGALVGGALAFGLMGIKSTIGDIRQELIATQVQADKVCNGLQFAVGKNEAVNELAFIKKGAQDLGLELSSTTGQYTKLASAARGTSLAGQGVRDIFTSMSQASTVMGLSAEQTEGALMAVTQMISKGKVQAEELRGQLGERLPGAFQVAARAMGMTTSELDKMLESGKLLSTDFLPKFAAQLSKEVAPQVEEASRSMQASINRLTNSWTSLKQSVNDTGVSKAIQSEISGMSNYVQSLSDAMANSKARGGGGIAQVNAALGNMIGRAPFDVLSVASNSLNGALNVLSLGALNLNTNLNLLPEVFRTNEQRTNALAAALPAAQDKIAKLSAQLAKAPDNIYLKDEVYQLSLFIERAKAAKAASDQLKGMGTEDSTKAGIRIGGQAREAYNAEQKQLGEDLVKVRMKLAGVDSDYLPTLEKLSRARELGAVSEKEYIRLVSELATANFKKGASEKATSDNAVQDLKARIIGERQYLQALKDVGLEADKANEGEKLTTKLTQELAGAMDAKTRASKESQLVQARILADVMKERDTVKETIAAHDKANKAADAEYLRQNADTEKINERAAAIELEVSAGEKLAVAIEKVAIARLKEQRDSLKFFDNSAEKVAAIEEEIKARERLVAAMDSKESSDNVKKAAKDSAAEWTRTADEINRTLTDSLMRAFEDGTGFGQAAAKTIEAMFKTMVLRPIISAVMSPISQGVNSVLGSLGIPGVGSGVGNGISGLGSASSLVGSGGSIMGGAAAFGGAFSSGSSLGFSAVSSGMEMMGSATGVSSFLAGAGQTVGGVIGGIGSGISSALAAIPVWGWIALALSTQLGGPKIDQVGDGLAGNLNLSGSKLQTTTDYTEDHHGLFGIGAFTTHNRSYSDADSGTTGYVDQSIALGTTAVQRYAEAIGLSADAVNGFSKDIDISLTGLTGPERQAKITQVVGGFLDDMVTSAYGGSLAAFAKEGETSSATLQRVAVDLTTVNNVFGVLGDRLLDVSVSGAAAAEGLVRAFGSLENFNASTSLVYQNYLTPEEQKAGIVKSIHESFVAAGITDTSESDIANATREQWATVLRGRGSDVSTEEGAKRYKVVVDAANRLNNFVPSWAKEQKVTPAADTNRVAVNTDSDAGVRAANTAADAIAKAWQQITDSIFGEVKRIQGLLDNSSKEALSTAMARFEMGNVMAVTGDAEAAKALPELSKNLLSVAEANARTLEELQMIRAQVADRLVKTGTTLANQYGTSIPAFASGGYHTGGLAIVGERGPELVNLPASRIFNNADSTAMLGGGYAALVTEVQLLREQVAMLTAAALRSADAAEHTDDQITKVTQGGAAMLTEAAT